MTDRVIGVGARDRGDDGVGPAVVEEVARRVGFRDRITVSTADPSGLIDQWEVADSVVLVDAIVDGSEPGTVRILDADCDPFPDDVAALSSHGMGVGAAVALARSLDRLPRRLIVVGVSGRDFDGSGLSEPVERAVPEAADIVIEMIRHA